LDFDLQNLLDDFSDSLAVSAHAKGLELCCIKDPGVPRFLRGDPGRVRQILTNLAGNAVKFTDRGEIEIGVSLEKERMETDCMLRFSVRDTGIGIPENKTGLLFQKFQQVDSSTTRHYGGTGLGLAISKQLAELMGGEVGFVSTEGKGSQFWFTVRLGEQVNATRSEDFRSARLLGVRALVVDDNATSRGILTALMDSWQMRPLEADGGPTALSAIYEALEQHDPFGVAVIDMEMPGMDGEALGRAIRSDCRLVDTRIVMLESPGFRHRTQLLQRSNAPDFLTKPIRDKDLFTLLCKVLPNEPICPLQPITTPRRRPQLPQLSGTGARILLAEDNVTNQEVALGILKKLGLRADAVADGAEAIKSLESIPYDLVLMDMRMPIMDGIEATRQIRNPRSSVLNHAIPIIAFTANAMERDRQVCEEAGMNGFVAKPVSPEELLQSLQTWLGTGNNPNPAAQEKPAPLADSFSQPVVFNRSSLLKSVMGDEELKAKVIEAFLDDAPHQLRGLKAFLENQDSASAGRQAHSIKSAAANVGGERLRQVALEMEKAADTADWSAVNERMAELEAQFLLLTEAMKKDRYAERCN